MPKLGALTGLRFFAALGIAILHAQGAMGVPSQLPEAFFRVLFQGVPFFFVLSGFILFYNYPTLPSAGSRARFLWSRFARLWPAHITAMLLVLALGVPYWGGLPEAVATILMVQAWLPFKHTYFSFNAVSWSISTEFAFYLAFPLLIPRFEQTWWWKLLLSLALCILMLLLCWLFSLPEDPDQGVAGRGLYYTSPVARLFEFVIGMVIALFWRRSGERLRVGIVAGTILEVASLAVLAGYGMFYVWTTRALDIPATGQVSPAWFAVLWYPAAASALVIGVFACRQGYLSRLLGTAPFIFLGEISYSIYLVHVPIRTFFASHEAVLLPVLGHTILVAYATTVLAVSSLIWWLVERPVRKLLLSLWPFIAASGRRGVDAARALHHLSGLRVSGPQVVPER